MNSVMDFLYLKWVDEKTKEKYVIGALCKDRINKVYYFKLNEDYTNKAKKCGFSTSILPFDDVNKIYESRILFPLFSLRVSDQDSDEFDDFETLRKTKGISVKDNFILEPEK